jgi:transposase
MHHLQINHSKLFSEQKNYINGIENFWKHAKRHMRKLNGFPKAPFRLYFKECEWRFNNSDPAIQLSKMPRYIHYGDEILYVIKGGFFEVPDPKIVPIAAGSTTRNVREVPHDGFTVVGDDIVEVITVHIVDKNRPLMELVK